MTFLILEILVFLLIAALIGFLAAWFIRGQAVAKAQAALADCEARAAKAPPPSGQPVTAVAAAEPPKSMPAKSDAAPTLDDAAKPVGLKAAEGTPDDLQAISGVGPKIEKLLHELGVFHYRQIAGWTADNVAWVDGYLKFRGRIQREDWIKQAKTLADGGETEFSKGRKKKR